MGSRFRPGILASAWRAAWTTGLALSASAWAMTASGQATTKKAAPPPPAAAAAPNPNEPLATVNGKPIPRSEVQRIVSQIELAPGATPEDAYLMAVNMLVNTELLLDHLAKSNVRVSENDMRAELAEVEKALKEQGRDLASFYKEVGIDERELRRQIERQKLWQNFFESQSKDDRLKAFVEANRDLFNGTIVAASHILIKVDEDAPKEEKERARQKLLAIKKEIEDKKLTFAQAADKYSEDEGNIQQKSGGNLGEFYRKGQLIEEFSAAAFALKPGVVSDPVETEFGYHLILVTDRREGKPFEFNNETKPSVMQIYEQDLREQIITEARKTAKIEIQPMPKDLTAASLAPPAPAPAAAPAPGGAAPKGAATPKSGGS